MCFCSTNIKNSVNILMCGIRFIGADGIGQFIIQFQLPSGCVLFIHCPGLVLAAILRISATDSKYFAVRLLRSERKGKREKGMHACVNLRVLICGHTCKLLIVVNNKMNCHWANLTHSSSAQLPDILL